MAMQFFENERVDQAVSVNVDADLGIPPSEVRRLVAWYLGWERAFRISRRKFFKWVQEANDRGGYERPQHLNLTCNYRFDLINSWHSYPNKTSFLNDKDLKRRID